MIKRARVVSLLAGSIVALALISVRAHAGEPSDSTWGDLGYSHPEKQTQVEPLAAMESDTDLDLPEDAPQNSIATAPAPKTSPKSAEIDNDEIATTISSAELAEARGQATQTETTESRPRKDFTDISTVQNTYGVETEERKPIAIYASPFIGLNSMFGNDTVETSPRYSAGISAGVVLGNNFLVQATFVHSESNLSNPTVNYTGILSLGDDAFLLKQNSFGGGGRFFILGRESRIRPFVGGGMAYIRSSLEYGTYAGTVAALASTYSNDLILTQYQGYGEVGAEVAITRKIVADLTFQVSGVLSSDTSGNATVDSTRAAVASSISRTASYMGSLGLGIYF